ncbi:hypothetical protein Tco_1421509, partial [Tanacetum coccineum]
VPLVYEHKPGYDNYYPQNSPSFPQQSLNCEKCGGPHEDYQCQPLHQNYSELNHCYDSNSYGFDQHPQYSIDHQPQEDLNQQRMNDVYIKWDDMIESRNKLLQSLGEMLRQREQAANLSTYTTEPSRHFNSFYDDDDYEESTIPLNEIVSQISPSIAITPVLPTLEPEDSLIVGDEDLSSIPEKESDEFIKSVEDRVPIPSESEDTSESDSDCDLPSCDDFSSIDVPRGNSMTFSNPLFDSNDDFTSSDDESQSDEDVPEDNVKIYSNPLFQFDDEYISSDVNPPFDGCGDVDEIELLLNRDPSTPKISVASILEGFTDEPHLEENDDLFDLESKENEWKKILYDAPIDDLMTEDKVFDPGIHEKKFSPTYDCPDYEDSRARGFVHRSLKLQSFACLYMGIRYPISY